MKNKTYVYYLVPWLVLCQCNFYETVAAFASTSRKGFSSKATKSPSSTSLNPNAKSRNDPSHHESSSNPSLSSIPHQYSKVERKYYQKPSVNDQRKTRKLKPKRYNYNNLSEKQLYIKTKQLLNSHGENGQMTNDQIQEAKNLLISFSKRPFANSGVMSEQLLRKLLLEKEAGNPFAKPGVELFNCCMTSWIKCGDVNGYQKALDLLKELNVYVQTHADIVAKKDEIAKCYGTVINGFCHAKTHASADLALELLERMDAGRDIKYFNAVMNAYATLYDHQSVLKIFQRIKDMGKKGEINFSPNRTSYNIVIKSLSGSNQMDCVRKAEAILLEMESAFRNGNRDISPDKITYTTVLSAWSKISNKQAVDKAEMYLERMHQLSEEGNLMMKPDSVTYNTMLNIIASSKSLDSGERCLKILNRMEQLHELGDEDVKPNLISYNAVIKAFSNNPFNDGARRSLMMLKKLENDEVLEPDIISYNSCLNAFAQAGDPISAQLLLDRMENMYTNGYHVKPDTYSYNTVISAWAFSGHEHAAEIAETIFDRMETSQIRLDTTTFNTLLSAWGRQKDPERATDILHHMFAVKKSGQYDVTPTSQSFAIVMNAWAKAKYPRKAFKAKQLLDEMKRRSQQNHKLKPNAYIYSSILNACAFSYGSKDVREEALSIAMEVFKECKQRNDVVFGTFIKACNALMESNDESRSEIIETVFVECRDRGMVSDFVLHELFSALSPAQYKKLLGCESTALLSTSDIPKLWNRNITKK